MADPYEAETEAALAGTRCGLGLYRDCPEPPVKIVILGRVEIPACQQHLYVLHRMAKRAK